MGDLPEWSLAPVVHALQALRGMALVAAATLVAELGDITRFANPGQDHQGWERRGTSHADRGRVELPVPGTDQPRASVATGGSGPLDSRHGVEGAGTTVSAISQARPGRKAADSGHYRNRA